MTANHEPIREDELEAYLDHALDRAASRQLEARIEADPAAREAVEMQQRIDESLRRAFLPPASRFAIGEGGLSPEPVTQPSADRQDAPLPWLSRRTVLIATAASAAWLLVAWQVTRHWDQRPVFVSRALVDVYHETVNAGFRPYYDCREEARFAEVFAQRQGQPLRLPELPPGRRMLGLSYPGGITRDTTAMLCEVDEQPVMVFVDRAEHDNALASQNPHSDLHVFRQALGPLVLYEVSPWSSPSVMGSLELLNQ